MLSNKPMTRPRKKNLQAVRRVERERVRYEDFLEINKLFREYLTRLKGTMGISNFVNKLYMAELTGAVVRIGSRSGIVVEERANSIVVVFEDDSVKTFLKRIHDFVVAHDGIDYIFVGLRMKSNRFVKK